MFVRIQTRQLGILSDLAINDDSILRDGFAVRDYILKDGALLDHLLVSFVNADLNAPKNTQMREKTLTILLRVYQRGPQLKDRVTEYIGMHKKKVEDAKV